LLVGDTFQLFLAVAVITMGATPFIMALAPSVANVTLRLPLPVRLKSGFSKKSESMNAHHVQELADRLLILDYGLAGRNAKRRVSDASQTGARPGFLGRPKTQLSGYGNKQHTGA
jgi:CPA2 family monovalent cation:H+ antiporter-2